MNEIKKRALGRGLSSLLGDSYKEEQEMDFSNSLLIPLIDIEPGLNQPRRLFSEEGLLSLSLSIKEKGVLQPILVRSHPQKEGKYEIVAGERRWRAAKLAKLDSIPALMREFSDVEALEVGLLENLQRQDLNPIDEAYGYRRLAEEFHHTQETLSRIVGKSRSHISNTLRLLTLPDEIQIYLKNGQLSAGHGRAILAAEDRTSFAEKIIKENLSVRQVENLAKQKTKQKTSGGYSNISDSEQEELRKHLSDLLGFLVELNFQGDGGNIRIRFKSATELDKILQKLYLIQRVPE